MNAPSTLILVGCGKAKRAAAAPARELYTGSLFRAARAYAEARACAPSGCPSVDWRILSAEHGLVHPDVDLEPYDTMLTDARVWAAWGSAVARAVVDYAHLHAPLRLVVLAGERYARPLVRPLVVAPGLWRGGILEVEQPLEGLQLGERLAWFKRERRRAKTLGRRDTIPTPPPAPPEPRRFTHTPEQCPNRETPSPIVGGGGSAMAVPCELCGAVHAREAADVIAQAMKQAAEEIVR